VVLNVAELIGFTPKEGVDHKGREKMQIAAKSNLVLTDFSFSGLVELRIETKYDALYQQIIGRLARQAVSKQALKNIGKRLITIAHHCYTLRQMDVVERVSQLLINLPLPYSYRSIGHYYHSFRLRQEGKINEAQALLETLPDKVPEWYRAKVVLSLAGLVFDNGDVESALSLYLEAGHIALREQSFDLFTATHTQKMVAVTKSISGDHRGALVDLETLISFAFPFRFLQPQVYNDYLNSFAVELTEAGRLEEASNVSRIVLASPYVFAYPEWRETGQEVAIRGYKSRSSVPIIRKIPVIRRFSGNVSFISERERSESRRSPFDYPRGVSTIADWKKKMV